MYFHVFLFLLVSGKFISEQRKRPMGGVRVLDVTVTGEEVVNVVSVAVDSGLVLARTFRDGFPEPCDPIAPLLRQQLK